MNLEGRYRFGKDLIAYLCNLLQDRLSRHTNKATALTVEQQVCIALRFYASGSFLQVIGDTLGYDKGTVSRVVSDVTDVLIDIKDDFTNHRGLIDGVILGDSGYACRPFLLTPYANPTERHQQRFNGCHASTRSVIERTFGILKRRFHVLHSEVRMKPEKVCRIFGACAVLHNIALSRNEPLVNDDGAGVRLDQPVQVPAFVGVQDGRNTREHVARVFFSN
ncbi:HARBI1 [Mytilus coruscus]|uniref:HARBI1 n=1 Tax=Mytilus coruscus TaxID=42192 RepID=A0A6J8CHU3_MYTCO|nr:HARBI1 [Mytilus coruscus]